MTNQCKLVDYKGFTDEVIELCIQYDMPYKNEVVWDLVVMNLKAFGYIIQGQIGRAHV